MCWYKVGPLSVISYNPRETPGKPRPQNSIYSDHRFGARLERFLFTIFFGATFSPERFSQVFWQNDDPVVALKFRCWKNAEVTFTSSITTSIGSMQTTSITSSITTLTTSHIATTTASTAVTATTFTMSCLDGLGKIASRELTYPPFKGTFESMIFLFPKWDMLVPWRVTRSLASAGHAKKQGSTFVSSTSSTTTVWSPTDMFFVWRLLIHSLKLTASWHLKMELGIRIFRGELLVFFGGEGTFTGLEFPAIAFG